MCPPISRGLPFSEDNFHYAGKADIDILLNFCLSPPFYEIDVFRRFRIDVFRRFRLGKVYLENADSSVSTLRHIKSSLSIQDKIIRAKEILRPWAAIAKFFQKSEVLIKNEDGTL